MDRRATILVVEDEPLLLDIVSTTLEEAGFGVLRAETGEAAAALLGGDARIDLLLTDIRLPGRLDGWDVAERARDHDPDLPVIYVTGYSPEVPRPVAGSVRLLKPYRATTILEAARGLGVG